MSTNSSLRALVTLAVAGLVATGAGCARNDSGQGAPPSPSVGAPTTGPTLTPHGTATATAPAAPYGPVWPLEPRNLAAAHPSPAPVLTAVRTGRHDGYDRLVFDFSGPFGPVSVRYVPSVHADPSDLTIPLLGNAFLEITIHDAYGAWGGQTPAYRGPASFTQNYPTLKQLTMSGDFENVLSFGAGVDRVAGFTVSRLQSPNRLVIDLAHAPAWRMWPDDSLALAERAQAAFDSGHQPWRTSVVALYARMVYGWNDATIVKLPGTDEYLVSAPGSTERIRVRQVWPFTATHRTSIAEIADVR